MIFKLAGTNASLDPTIEDLVGVRVAQINGCAHCLDRHTAGARARGETEQRLYLLPAWREAPCYSPRERAALAWTEARTQLSRWRDREAARRDFEGHFSEEDQMKLTLLIDDINGASRLTVSLDTWPEEPARRMAA